MFAEIEVALRELTAKDREPPAARRKAPMPRAPVSWGELIDKITILEIKRVELAAETARANVEKELSLLESIAEPHTRSPEIAELRERLRAVNAELRRIEDATRLKERQKEFDQDFVELARSVYQKKDERAGVKRRINRLMESDIVEEKSYETY